jgi:hypothetical protein
MDPTTATGVNLLKSGSDPKLGPDEAYPDWLWTLVDTPQSKSELERQAASVPRGQRIPLTLDEVRSGFARRHHLCSLLTPDAPGHAAAQPAAERGH